MATRRLRPHGAGRAPQNRHGSAHRAGGLAHRRHHDGAPPELSAPHLLAHTLQRKLSAHASGRRRIPAQRCDDRPRTGSAHLRLPHIRPRCGPLLLYPRASRLPRQYAHPRRHINERRLENRPRRLPRLSAVARTVRRQRQPHSRRGGRSHPGQRLRTVWKDWDKIFD